MLRIVPPKTPSTISPMAISVPTPPPRISKPSSSSIFPSLACVPLTFSPVTESTFDLPLVFLVRAIYLPRLESGATTETRHTGRGSARFLPWPLKVSLAYQRWSPELRTCAHNIRVGSHRAGYGHVSSWFRLQLSNHCKNFRIWPH